MLSDREPLNAAQAEGFDILVTTNSNLRFQQVLSRRSFGVIVLMTTDGRINRKATGSVVDAVHNLTDGAHVEAPFPAGNRLGRAPYPSPTAAARNPSPAKFTASTAAKMHSPGGIASQGALISQGEAWLRRPPQVGMGG